MRRVLLIAAISLAVVPAVPAVAQAKPFVKLVSAKVVKGNPTLDSYAGGKRLAIKLRCTGGAFMYSVDPLPMPSVGGTGGMCRRGTISDMVVVPAGKKKVSLLVSGRDRAGREVSLRYTVRVR